MIPSEFNQDAKAARRKLQLLAEAKTKAMREARGIERSFRFKTVPKANTFIKKIRDNADNVYGMERGSIGGANVRATFVSQADANDAREIAKSLGGEVIRESVDVAEAVSIVAADNRTGEVILKVLGQRSSPGSPSKEETRLALLADRIGGAVFKPVGSRVSSAFGGGKNLFSFKVDRFKKPEDVAKLLRKELGSLFKSVDEVKSVDEIMVARRYGKPQFVKKSHEKELSNLPSRAPKQPRRVAPKPTRPSNKRT